MARILVVDDVPVVRLVIAKFLRHAGHSVIEAAEGGEALAHLRSDRPDVVLTDVWMPGTDGLGLATTINAEFPGLVVVAMTGGRPHSTMDESIREAVQSGALTVLGKPIDKGELLAAVAQALAVHGTIEIKP